MYRDHPIPTLQPPLLDTSISSAAMAKVLTIRRTSSLGLKSEARSSRNFNPIGCMSTSIKSRVNTTFKPSGITLTLATPVHSPPTRASVSSIRTPVRRSLQSPEDQGRVRCTAVQGLFRAWTALQHHRPVRLGDCFSECLRLKHSASGETLRLTVALASWACQTRDLAPDPN